MAINDDDKAALEIYCKMYIEHATQARHHETLRATVSGFMVTAAGTLVIFARPSYNVYNLGWVVVTIAILGCLLSLKHYERNRRHTRIQIAFSDEINSIMERYNFQIARTYETAKQQHRASFWFLRRIRLYMLWTAIFMLLLLLGFSLVIYG